MGFSPLGREDVRLVPVLSGAGWGVGGGELGVKRRVGVQFNSQTEVGAAVKPAECGW